MKKTEMNVKAIINGGISLTISTIIVKILGLIYKIPLAAILHDEGMGYFNSAYTIYSLFYLLCTAGVPKAIMILVSDCNARADKEKGKRIVSVALDIFLYIGIVLCILLAVFAFPLSKLIGNSGAAVTIIFVAPSIIFSSLTGVLRGYLNAEYRLIDIAVSQILEGVVKLVAGLIGAHFAYNAGMTTWMISAITILGVSLGSLSGFVYLSVCAKIKKAKENTGQRGLIKSVFKISAPITLSGAIMSLTNIIDLGFIMNSLESIGYTEAEAGALYGNYTTLAVPMLNLALAILTPISVAFVPAITSAIAKNDMEDFAQTENTSIRLCSFICAPMVVGLMTYSYEILHILFPSSDAQTGASLLCLLSPAIIFSSLVVIVNNSLEAGGRVKAPLISMSVGCIVKILVSFFVIKKPSLGIIGAPIGTVLCYATALIISVIIYRIEFNKNIEIFSGIISSFIFALSATLLSKPLYQLLVCKISETLSLTAVVIFSAVVYFAFSILYDQISRRCNSERAKYTKIKNRNCKINT